MLAISPGLMDHQLTPTNEDLISILIKLTHTNHVSLELGNVVDTFKCLLFTILVDEFYLPAPFNPCRRVVPKLQCALHTRIEISECRIGTRHMVRASRV
jgi:hypothetical protein